MVGFSGNIEELTLANDFFRKVLFTTSNCQLVVMSLNVGEDIGMEVHDVDQFFRFEQGHGKVIIDGTETSVANGDVVIVPSGSSHNVINLGTDKLKLYTLYCPKHHPDGTIHKTKNEAQESEINEHKV